MRAALDLLTPWNGAALAAALVAAGGLYNAGHRAGRLEAEAACRGGRGPSLSAPPSPAHRMPDGPPAPMSGGMRY